MFSTLFELFFVACSASVVDFGNNVLKISNGSRLLPGPKSILYVMHALLWLVTGSNLLNITDVMLAKLMYLIFTKSKHCLIGLVSSAGAPHLAWHYALICYFSVVSSPSASALTCTLPWSGWLSHIPHVSVYTGHCLCRYPVPNNCKFLLISAFFGLHCHVFMCCLI